MTLDLHNEKAIEISDKSKSAGPVQPHHTNGECTVVSRPKSKKGNNTDDLVAVSKIVAVANIVVAKLVTASKMMAVAKLVTVAKIVALVQSARQDTPCFMFPLSFKKR